MRMRRGPSGPPRRFATGGQRLEAESASPDYQTMVGIPGLIGAAEVTSRASVHSGMRA